MFRYCKEIIEIIIIEGLENNNGIVKIHNFGTFKLKKKKVELAETLKLKKSYNK